MRREKRLRTAGIIFLVCVLLLSAMYLAAERMQAETPEEIQTEPATPTKNREYTLPGYTQGALLPCVAKAKPVQRNSFTDAQLETLAIVIYREAGGNACSDATRQMVGEVFLNRVASDRYPDTFHGVATQRSQYGRLHWTGICWPERAATLGELHAVQRAYKTALELLTGEAARILPTDAVYQAEFEQGTETLVQQNGLYFCR